VLLAGCTIRIYYDAWTYECQTYQNISVYNTSLLELLTACLHLQTMHYRTCLDL